MALNPMRAHRRKGLDLPIGGSPKKVIDSAPEVKKVALLGADYIGLEPKMLVVEGDRVALGQPLFHHKRDPAIVFTAPASGTIAGINRGERRVLKSVVIDIDGEDDVSVRPGPTAGRDITADDLRARLLESGLWTAFRTRPFSKVSPSTSAPRSIFVTAVETRPLAGALTGTRPED